VKTSNQQVMRRKRVGENRKSKRGPAGATGTPYTPVSWAEEKTMIKTDIYKDEGEKQATDYRHHPSSTTAGG